MNLILCSFTSQNLYSQSGWVQINPGFGHTYNGVHFVDANTGMACGLGGAIVKTTNGGLNWTNLNSGTTIDLNEIGMFSANVAIAAGNYKLIIKTTNGGQNWFAVNPVSALNHSFKNLKISSGYQAETYCEYYSYPYDTITIYTTFDQGLSWTYQSVNFAVNWIHFINLNTGWAVSSNGNYLNVHKTINWGNNWSSIYNIPSYNTDANLIYFYDTSLGFITENIQGVREMIKTTNSGYNWWSSGMGYFSSGINCIYFVNSSYGWLVGESSFIYSTSNSGVNWVQQTTTVNANLKKVFFIDNNNGWIAASQSGILRTTNGGVTGLITENSNIPQKHSLSQNYPNPFNPTTKIKFDVPSNVKGETSNVKLIIYDILGCEVATLVNEELKPGSYEYEWDATNFASGVYFYQLQTESFTQTRRMVLLK